MGVQAIGLVPVVFGRLCSLGVQVVCVKLGVWRAFFEFRAEWLPGALGSGWLWFHVSGSGMFR